ncbi:MAG: CDP-alcohol phosphatidyltransferase [Thermococcus sibiricus]|uniref:CDP-alcohol phosphatidyltransferase n=1 Tax=Thermococcus sibiricus TaxID=172049 RepID=A0A101ENX0_9EURY|nr:MAG: CDP-alcohol phosphatidyltransferase [Thermococcus sibiricus]
MVGYFTERYKDEYCFDIYKVFTQMKYLSGKRNKRMFIGNDSLSNRKNRIDIHNSSSDK